MKEIKKKSIKSPEDTLELVKSYWNQDRKLVFFLSMGLGILTHFLLLSHLILSQDGLLNGIHYTAGGYEATLGRWGIDFFDSLRNNIAFPFITTLISLVILGFTNNLLLDLFQIKGRIFRVLTVVSLVVSPSLCMTLLYAYTADVYFYAMFLAVFTVYSLYRVKNRKLAFALGMIAFVLMLSTYQSYMGMTVGLIVMLTIQDLLTGKKAVLDSLKDLGKKALQLASYVVVYYLVTQIILKVNQLTMSNYGGLSGIGWTKIFGELGNSLKNAYLAFIKYFLADGIILNRIWKREKWYLVFFSLMALSLLILLKNGWTQKNTRHEFLQRFGLAVGLLAILPIALNLVIIAAPGNKIYYLTASQMTLIFPFVFAILEISPVKSMISSLLNWGVVVTGFVILTTYFLSIQVTYETTEISFNQAKSVTERVIERMESYPGYRSDMSKLFAGVIDDVNFPKTLDIYNYALTNSLRTSILHATYWGHKATWANFYQLFFGMPVKFCEDYEYYTIIHSDEFQQMDIFPGQNSVKMIDDVMVVKFTDTPAEPPPSQNLVEHGIEIK